MAGRVVELGDRTDIRVDRPEEADRIRGSGKRGVPATEGDEYGHRERHQRGTCTSGRPYRSRDQQRNHQGDGQADGVRNPGHKAMLRARFAADLGRLGSVACWAPWDISRRAARRTYGYLGEPRAFADALRPLLRKLA